MSHNVVAAQKALNDELTRQGLEVALIPSSDAYLSEYVEHKDNPRILLTGFTGSMGDALYFSADQRAELFVDGRYHLQADQECAALPVLLQKVDNQSDIEVAMLNRLSQAGVKDVLAPRGRLAYSFLRRLESAGIQVHHFSADAFLKACGWGPPTRKVKFKSLTQEVVGTTAKAQLERLRSAMEKHAGANGLYVAIRSDDVAYLLASRSFGVPNQTSILGAIVVTKKSAWLLLDPSLKYDSIPKEWELAGYRMAHSQEEILRGIASETVSSILFHPNYMNGLWPHVLQTQFPSAKQDAFEDLIGWRASKTKEELSSIRDSFLRSSRSIARTVRYGIEQGTQLTEYDLAERIASEYKAEGAVDLSFKTISGIGANAAIVHYNRNSKEVSGQPGEFVLLDSGAYYASGFATDCTRGFAVRGKSPEPWQKKMYTTCLKAALKVFLNKIPLDWDGKQVDDFVRSSVKEHGYDYLHGTGHGVGILVHEEGIRFSQASTFGLSDQAVVSVEPGIYLKGKGGVRIENVVALHKDADGYRFENLVYVGYDWSLIDLDALNEQESRYLKSYEMRCQELGTAITACPL
jgi:Xaa-Pro aminopeptidase